MANCSHCNIYEPVSNGMCRRCNSARVWNPERFERLRWVGWPCFTWEIIKAIVRMAWPHRSSE